jgi:hypothetical protein
MKFIHTLLFVASLGGVASAASPIIVQTSTVAAYPAGDPTIFTFNKFNPALGTLTSVTVGFSFDASGGSLQVDNDGLSGATVTFGREVKGKLTSADVTVGNNTTYRSAITEFDHFVAADDGDRIFPLPEVFDVGGTDYYSYAPGDELGTNNSANISSELWAAYTGTGTYNVNFVSLQSFYYTGIGALQIQSTAASIAPTVTVTYNYIAAVPEPASTLLGGIGLLALLRRRRA